MPKKPKTLPLRPYQPTDIHYAAFDITDDDTIADGLRRLAKTLDRHPDLTLRSIVAGENGTFFEVFMNGFLNDEE